MTIATELNHTQLFSEAARERVGTMGQRRWGGGSATMPIKYTFEGGFPDPGTFPMEALADVTRRGVAPNIAITGGQSRTAKNLIRRRRLQQPAWTDVLARTAQTDTGTGVRVRIHDCGRRSVWPYPLSGRVCAQFLLARRFGRARNSYRDRLQQSGRRHEAGVGCQRARGAARVAPVQPGRRLETNLAARHGP